MEKTEKIRNWLFIKKDSQQHTHSYYEDMFFVMAIFCFPVSIYSVIFAK
jgi:hypothetical protein